MAHAFPDLQLHLDPDLAPVPSPDGAPATPSLVPPLSLDPLSPYSWLPDLSMGPTSPDVFSDVFGHYTDPGPGSPGGNAMSAITGAVAGLGTRPGLQVDKQGIGTTLGDWKMRFMPYIPWLNEP